MKGCEMLFPQFQLGLKEAVKKGKVSIQEAKEKLDQFKDSGEFVKPEVYEWLRKQSNKQQAS